MKLVVNLSFTNLHFNPNLYDFLPIDCYCVDTKPPRWCIFHRRKCHIEVLNNMSIFSELFL